MDDVVTDAIFFPKIELSTVYLGQFGEVCKTFIHHFYHLNHSSTTFSYLFQPFMCYSSYKVSSQNAIC